MTKAAIWARVSDPTQEVSGQLTELRDWASARDLDVVAEYVTEDSAWVVASKNGNGGAKGSEFDRKRDDLLDGARLGRYSIVLVWGLDRLSRRGSEDMLAFTRRLTETGCSLWSMKDPWVESLKDPMVREMLLGIFATIARFESERRSERIRMGMARAKREGRKMGGRKAGAKDKRPRDTTGVRAAWTDERKAQASARNEARWAERRSQAVTLASQGTDPGEIASQIGVKEETILRWLEEAMT